MAAPKPSPLVSSESTTLAPAAPTLKEVLPKQGIFFHERSNLAEVLCKPRIMPIKSITLEKLEKMEREAQEALQRQRAEMLEQQEEYKRREAASGGW